MSRKPPFTQVPNEFLDDETLNPYEFRLLMIICRQTYGWKKDKDKISLSQYMQKGKMSKTTVKRSLKSLLDRGYIVKHPGKERTDIPEYEIAMALQAPVEQKPQETMAPQATGVGPDRPPQNKVLKESTTPPKEGELFIIPDKDKTKPNDKYEPFKKELLELKRYVNETHNKWLRSPVSDAQVKQYANMRKRWEPIEFKQAIDAAMKDEFWKKQCYLATFINNYQGKADERMERLLELANPNAFSSGTQSGPVDTRQAVRLEV